MTPSSSRTCDVLVAGSGPAGIAASIAAARGGADTVLVEEASGPGGNVFRANVHTICGLFEPGNDDPVPLHNGFPLAFAAELHRNGGARDPEQVGDVHVLPIYPTDFSHLAEQWIRTEKTLSAHYNTRVRDVEHERDGWTVRTTDDASNETIFQSRLLLDTTGDAVASKKAGAACMQGAPDELQIPSFIVQLSGLPDTYLHGFEKLRLQHSVAEGVKEGVLPEGCESILIRPGKEDGTGYATLNMPRTCSGMFDPFQSERVRDFEEEARRRVRHVVQYLRDGTDDLTDLDIRSFPERIGIRETRRMEGRTVMTRQQILDGDHSADQVAKSGWPVELWQDHTSPRIEQPDAPCDVPLDSLISTSYVDLGAAGRCMSASREALGALRVIATSMATGEALGFAAARTYASGDLTNADPAWVRHQKQASFSNKTSDPF
jgi:glycine/D-amino acid oxidase-like deaminating enzyme